MVGECGMLRRYATLFWDFDGVIKDSVAVKAAAFERLFAPFGAALAARVRAHHECNGGMSRYEKLPLYLQWAGHSASEAEVSAYCEQFSVAVRQATIDSPWVPGAREYLLANRARQCLVLVSATPQGEMEDILRAVGIASCFHEVHGAPTPKLQAIQAALERRGCAPADALMIGDSDSDYVAAKAAGLAFLLRRTPLNHDLQRRHGGLQCEDFRDETS
jgi:phosphoglycolate phosphatase-like HAD superfamily hydrolase